ncbi:MAG: ComEC/Rec2 family competence protein, partial [Flavobacteriaceae bacterium]
EELKASSYYKRYIASVEVLDQYNSGGRVLCRVKLNVITDTLQADDELMVRAPLSEIRSPENPYQFNYKKYLSHLGVTHQIELTKSNFVITAREPGSISGWAERVRQEIIEGLDGLAFSYSELSIIKALVLGFRKDIDDNVHRNYKEAGALHILAVSGLHVGVILLFLQYVLKPLEHLRAGKSLKLILCVALLWGFAFLAGFSPSVVRAVTMFSFLAYALYLNRPGNTFNILALSMFFILLVIDPFLLFQPGFQLSYAAVFSILWVYPKLMNYWMPKQTILKKAWQLFSVGLAAQLGVLPLSLYYFHQFPGLFFLSNLIVVPFLGIILGMGIVVIILSIIGMVPDFMVSMLNGLILAMNETVAWIARQQIFLIKDIYFDSGHLILTSLLMVFVLRLLDRFRPKRIISLLLCFLAIQLWSHYSLISTLNTKQLTLSHTIGVSVLLYQNGTSLQALTDYPDKARRLLDDYRSNNHLVSESIDSLANIYFLNQKRLVIIDQDHSGLPPALGTDILLLSGSPRINLDRYLLQYRPSMVIADGSNYKSYVSRWKQSCSQLDISFHDTANDGAISLEVK